MTARSSDRGADDSHQDAPDFDVFSRIGHRQHVGIRRTEDDFPPLPPLPHLQVEELERPRVHRDLAPVIATFVIVLFLLWLVICWYYQLI